MNMHEAANRAIHRHLSVSHDSIPTVQSYLEKAPDPQALCRLVVGGAITIPGFGRATSLLHCFTDCGVLCPHGTFQTVTETRRIVILVNQQHTIWSRFGRSRRGGGAGGLRGGEGVDKCRSAGIPSSVPASMAIEKKPSVVPPSQGPLSSRCVDSQRKANAPKASTEKSNNAKPNVPTKNNTVSSPTVNNCSIIPSGPRLLAGPTGPNVDERLRLARERREEKEKLLASRELGRLEREQRARRYYELQLETRKRKLLEQRVKEEGRRTAVEEKRKQRQREEKERYESAVRKTLEKSQRLQHNLTQISRGRLHKNTSRCSPLTAWERNLVSRLLTPTCSYLARSRSAGCLSGQEVVHVCRRSVSCHSMNTIPKNNQAIHHHKPPQQTGTARQRGPARHTRPAAPPSPGSSKPRSHSLPQIKAEKQHQLDKKSKTRSNAGTPPVNTSRAKSAPTKTNQTTLPIPSPQRSPRRPIRRQSFSMPPELPSVPEEELPVCVPASSDHALFDHAPSGPTLSPGNARPIILTEERPPGVLEVVKCPPESLPRSDSSDDSTTKRASSRTSIAATGMHKPPEAASRPAGGGTTNREEALRLLAERRKEARLQREQEKQRERREEEESRSREEAELRRVEQEDLRRAEERSRQQAEEQTRLHVEAQRLVEEKRRREEEEHRRAEEERTQAMREAALLQKKREEEQAVEREKAEQVKREREDLAQKEDAERQARRKRLEEIMRRTRRTDATDTKLAPDSIAPTETRPKENTEPVNNGHTGPVTRQSAGLKPAQRGMTGIEDMVPVVAFKERRTIRTLTGLDEIQTHQRTATLQKSSEPHDTLKRGCVSK
ncbi:unnamed protein product [Lota lota]